MANNIYGAIALTGGAAGALDAIDGTDLADKDMAMTLVQGDKAYLYVLDADSGASESSPSVISPDANAGTKRWILHGVYYVPALPDPASASRFLYSEGSPAAWVEKTVAQIKTVLGMVDVPSVNAVNDFMLGAGSPVAWTKKTLSETKTILEGPVLNPSPTDDHSFSGPSASLTAGETVVFGELCYMKSDGKMWKADADASTTMPGIAIAGASINADASGTFILPGSFIRDDSWTWTVGGLIYAGSGATGTHTAGAINQSAPNGTGDQVQVVGVATHADRMYFDPSLVTIEL
jgi:hypothetical protein